MSPIERLLKKIRGRKADEGPQSREPNKPSQAFMDRAWKEIELIQEEMRTPQPRVRPVISPKTYDPVPTSALWKGEEYWGHPDGTEYVDDLISYLEGCRNQSLWFSFILGCNYDIAHSLTVVRWMLEQPDCDAVNALAAFECLQGNHLCGMPASDVSPSYDDSLSALKIIEAREIANRSYVTKLGPWKHVVPYLDKEQVLMNARSQAAGLQSGERPALLIPTETLRSAGTGERNIIMYCVDECTVWVEPKLGRTNHYA
jgi:Domain of unknown function (DUF4274)